MDDVRLIAVRRATGDVRTFIAELDETLARAYPPEQRHGITVDAIFQPHMRFSLAWLGNVVVGYGGIALFATFGKVKRRYVRAEARGRGVGGALLACVRRIYIDAARSDRDEHLHGEVPLFSATRPEPGLYARP